MVFFWDFTFSSPIRLYLLSSLCEKLQCPQVRGEQRHGDILVYSTLPFEQWAGASSLGIAWELVRNEDSWALPQTYEI